MSSAKARRVLPRLRPVAWAHARVPVADRAHPALGGLHQERLDAAGRTSGTCNGAARHGVLSLSFGASLLAAAINVVFGLMLAWSLVRYTFPGDASSTR